MVTENDRHFARVQQWAGRSKETSDRPTAGEGPRGDQILCWCVSGDDLITRMMIQRLLHTVEKVFCCCVGGGVSLLCMLSGGALSYILSQKCSAESNGCADANHHVPVCLLRERRELATGAFR